MPYKDMEKRRQAKRSWKKRHPEEVNRMRREYMARYPDKIKENNRKRTIRARERKHAAASWPMPDACECCGRDDVELVFDHDHKTGLFRGWLCNRCNLTLGMVKDDQQLLHFLLMYLKRAELNTDYAWKSGIHINQSQH